MSSSSSIFELQQQQANKSGDSNLELEPASSEESSRLFPRPIGGFNILDQIKRSAGGTPVNLLSISGMRGGSSSDKFEATLSSSEADSNRNMATTCNNLTATAGATPSLKKMRDSGHNNMGENSPLGNSATFTTLTASLSDESSGFDMNRHQNASLFRGRYPPFSNTSNEEFEIQFQSDPDDNESEDNTWSAPFSAAAKAITKQVKKQTARNSSSPHHQMRRCAGGSQQQLQLQHQVVDDKTEEAEKIWKTSFTAAAHAISEKVQRRPSPGKKPLQERNSNNNIHPREEGIASENSINNKNIIDAPEGLLQLSLTEQESLIQVASYTPTMHSIASLSCSTWEDGMMGPSSNALLDMDDGYDDDDTATMDGDMIDVGDDNTIDDDTTLAGETVLDDDDDYTFQEEGPGDAIESFLDDLADVDSVGKLGTLFFPGQCGRIKKAMDDDDDLTYVTDAGSISRPSYGGLFGASAWNSNTDNHPAAEVSFSSENPVPPPPPPPPTSHEEAATEGWSLLTQLKAMLDDATTATVDGSTNNNNNNTHTSFFASLFSCNG